MTREQALELQEKGKEIGVLCVERSLSNIPRRKRKYPRLRWGISFSTMDGYKFLISYKHARQKIDHIIFRMVTDRIFSTRYRIRP